MSNKIAHIFKTIAMEGTSAPDTDVQAFYGRTYQTNDGKTDYSAIVEIRTKYSDLMSSNSGF